MSTLMIASPLRTPVVLFVAAFALGVLAPTTSLASSHRRSDIDATIDAIAAETIRVATLCKDIEITGRANDEQRAFLAAVVDSPPEEFSRATEGTTVPLNFLLEIHLARFAHERLRTMLDSTHPPRVEDLLLLATEDFLAANRETAAAIDPDLAVGIDASLARPLSARWLLFAALREDRLFDHERGVTKTEFISRLLLASESSEAMAFLVRGTLQPPFAATWGRSGLAFPAGPFKNTRGKVGFAEEHEAILRSLEQARSFEAALDREKPPLSSEIGDARGERDYVAEHLAILRDWILTELHPDRAATPIGSDVRNVSDLEHEWRELAAGLNPNEFWSLAKPMLLALVRGEVPHAHDARIAELLAQGDDLTDAERRELALLKRERDADQVRLMSLLPELFAEHAPAKDAFERLLECEREIAAFCDSEFRDTILGEAFGKASYQDPRLAAALLDQHSAVTSNDALPQSARTAMIRAISAFGAEIPNAAAILRRLAIEGEDIDRLHSLTAIRLQSPDVAEDLITRAGNDCRSQQQSGQESSILRAAFATAINERAKRCDSESERGRLVAMWVASFDQDGVNLWDAGIPISNATEGGQRTWRNLANLIPESDWLRLDLAGKLPEDLKRFRD